MPLLKPMGFLTDKRSRMLVTALTWGAPALVIPALRFFQDSPETRKKLFTRDLSTYSVGAALYFVTGYLTLRLLQATRILKLPVHQEMVAFLTALTANLLYAGIGAVRLSNILFPTPKLPPALDNTRLLGIIAALQQTQRPKPVIKPVGTWTGPPMTAYGYSPRPYGYPSTYAFRGNPYAL